MSEALGVLSFLAANVIGPVKCYQHLLGLTEHLE